MPIHKLAVVAFTFLAFICVIGGIIAVILNAKSKTEIDIFGAHLTTGHVGVALIGIGLIMTFFTFRAVFKSQQILAALPDVQHSARPSTYRDASRMKSPTGLATIVDEAIADGAKRQFTRIPFRPREATLESAIALRAYFGRHLALVLPFVRAADAHSVSGITQQIDRLIADTWLRHLLDSDVDAYVLQDYLTELVDTVDARGGRCERLTYKRMRHLAVDWMPFGVVGTHLE